MSIRTATNKHFIYIGLLLISSILVGAALMFAQETPFALANPDADAYTMTLPVVIKTFPPPSTIFGVQMTPIRESGGLNLFKDIETSWTRRDFPWSSVESTQGARNWTSVAGLESELINAANAGIRVLVIVGGTPAWALKDGFTCGAIAPDKLADFADFMYDLVRRYSVPPYNVKYWEIYNEPDASGVLGCWGDPNDPWYYGGAYYGEMLKAIYPKVKAADPSAKLLVGGLLLVCDPVNPPPDPNNPGQSKDCTPSKFLQGSLETGAGNSFDGVSFHAYDYYLGGVNEFFNSDWNSWWNTTGPVVNAKVQYLQSLLAQYGVSGKILLNTEAGLICSSCGDFNQVYENAKADYVPKTYSQAADLGLKANVWFSAFGWRHSGLIHTDLSLRPGYHAYKFAGDMLARANYAGRVNPAEVGGDQGIMGFKYHKDGAQIWVLWALNGSPHNVSFATAPDAIYDSQGNSLAVSGNVVSVTVATKYLVWNPN